MSMSYTIFDLREMTKEDVIAAISKTIARFPKLKELYDDNFVTEIANKRLRADNYILWLLASGDESASHTIQKILDGIEVLRDCDGIEKLRAKIRQMEKTKFVSALNELEFSAYFLHILSKSFLSSIKF